TPGRPGGVARELSGRSPPTPGGRAALLGQPAGRRSGGGPHGAAPRPAIPRARDHCSKGDPMSRARVVIVLAVVVATLGLAEQAAAETVISGTVKNKAGQP